MSFRSRSGVTGVFYVPGFPKGVKWLLISNATVFIVAFFLQRAELDGFLRVLPLVPVQELKGFYLWQLATYLFLHQGFFHITLNILWLWGFGAVLENNWGTPKFLRFYFNCELAPGISVSLPTSSLPW